MAVGLAPATANAFLNALGNATDYTAPADRFIKLHIGDPGAAGTANAAGNTTRKTISFGAAAGGAMSNDVAVTWTSVSTTEDYTHASFWDDVSAGAFLFSGTITANAVTAADDFTLPIGDIDLSFSVAA